MEIFWELIIEPALLAMRPRRILEIGSEGGGSTRRLLEFCQRYDAVLHAIDPQPRFDVAAWQHHYGSHFVMHCDMSLRALPTMDRFDVVLLDGDHNWYTVYNELKLIERRSGELSQPFPLILFHDIGWPYGRRDLYYNPASIPDAGRQPFARSGIRPGTSELVDRAFNAELCNAISENTPRNGVLTAIEDFLKESAQPLRFIKVPGLFGLGMMFLRQLPEQNEAFAEFLKTWDLPEPIRQYLQLMEDNRVSFVSNCAELLTVLKQVTGR